MKKIFTLLVCLAAIGMATAQSPVLNGGFENWTTSPDEPQYWNSNKSGGGNANLPPATCTRDQSVYHSGTSSAKVATGTYFFTAVNGSLTTGRVMAPSTNKAEGYIQTIPGDPNFSMPFTGRPDSLVFWYRYDSYSSDYPNVEARLHVGYAYAPETPVNGNHPDSSQNIIARAAWTNVPNFDVTTWTRVSMPFTYVDGRTPQYILITTTSSGNQTGGTSGSTLWLDDFEAIYNPTIAVGTIAPTTYYVSMTDAAPISVPFTLTGTYQAGNTVTAQLSNASGSFASPVTLGSVTATTSGTITGSIPPGTATGTGYRIRVVSSNPVLTSADNGVNLSINLVNTSVSPSSSQGLAINTNGNVLTVTESAGAVSREWKYATSPGGPYSSFAPAQTATTYTPRFTAPGTYYVVCQTQYPNSLSLTSNEVVFNVVGNSIAPTTSQSILVGVDGTQLTVTETPAGMWREWMYATTSGGPYVSFSPAITGATTYTPNFASAGTYYVICYSEINSIFSTSNEVLISVGNASIATSAISGSPFEFSPSAPAASVSVPFTTSGTFNNGNTFTAQLSDATGSFGSPTDIGTLSATNSGTVSASIPAATPAGTGYRIRVISDNPPILGSDNGTDLVIDQFANSIAPASAQTIMHSTNGTAVTVTASQTSTQEWKYSTTSGSGYMSFAPAETGAAYTPNFATPSTYYVVAVSKNQYNDEVTSSEVEINVTNGTQITTTTATGSPFYISPSANETVTVNFTTDVVFNSGNEFKVQLSDQSGSFAVPVEIGSLASATPTAVTGQIPNSSVEGSGYRVRVISTDPAVVGSVNGSDLSIVPFYNAVSPTDTQNILVNVNGNVLSVTESHPSATHNWMYSELPGFGYVNFNPTQTGATCTPKFTLPSTYYVICKSTNSASDVINSNEVVVIVTRETGISETELANSIKIFWNAGDLIINTTSGLEGNFDLTLTNVSGQTVLKQAIQKGNSRISNNLPQGLYLFSVTDGTAHYNGRLVKF